MVRSLALLTSTALAVTLSVSGFTGAAEAKKLDPCSVQEKLAGDCFTVASDQSAVEGSGFSTTTSGGRSGGRGTVPDPGSSVLPRPFTGREAQAAVETVCVWNQGCGDDRSPTDGPLLPPPADPAAPGAPAVPPRVVTVADVARFLPAAATMHAEPDGWAVVRVPANFWVDVAPVTVGGELLGQQVQVRFTPRAYRWDYGDGDQRTTTAPGSTWAALGQDELTETATSHLYQERATVDPAVTVLYAAAYRVGGGDWTGIDGAVVGTTPPIRTLVVHERTALVSPTR